MNEEKNRYMCVSHTFIYIYIYMCVFEHTYIHTMEYYSVTKKDEILSFAAK
jgi:hypothetical protein